MRHYKTTLPNGLRIITVPMPDNPTVTVSVVVEAGTSYETKDINGLSHFLEHMCFKGTANRPTAIDISHELDALGAQSNAFTWYEFTGYWGKAQSRHFHKILDVVSDVYLNSTFPEEEIEKEKGVITGEIDMYNDSPSFMAGENLYEILYKNQPRGWPVLGPKKNIRAIKRSDFVEYRKKHYVADATIVVVSGNVDHKDVVKSVKDKFKNILTSKKYSKKKVIEKQSRPQVKVQYKKTDQTHLAVGFRAFHANHKDLPILELLTGVLGRGMSSRLFQRVREQMGAGYYVKALDEAYTDHGLIKIIAGVDNRRVNEVIEAILEECRRLIDEKVSDKELKKAKEYIIGNMNLSLESSDALADFYGIQEILKHKLLNPKEIAQKIKSVTASDIKRVAKKIFQNKNLNLALIGPFKDKAQFAKILKL